MARRSEIRQPALAVAIVALGLAAVCPQGARAGCAQLAAQFAGGNWEQARAMAGERQPDARPGELALWRSRLATSPESALEILGDVASGRKVSAPVRVRVALEAAELDLGRGRPADAVKVLSPLLEQHDDLPGAVAIMAARALLAIGRGPRARETLAGVRASDPAYAVSRAVLGDIALTQGDGTQALRWYDAADQADPTIRSRTVSGRCRALLLAGKIEEVEALEADLNTREPGSLALLEIRRARLENEELSTARRPTPPLPPAATGADDNTPPGDDNSGAAAPTAAPGAAPVAAAAGRYALQFGAFSDRARALDFLERFRSQIDGLAIEEGVDAQGKAVYRARAGGWDSPDVAAAFAGDLGRRVGLDVIVVDRQASARPGG